MVNLNPRFTLTPARELDYPIEIPVQGPQRSSLAWCSATRLRPLAFHFCLDLGRFFPGGRGTTRGEIGRLEEGRGIRQGAGFDVNDDPHVRRPFAPGRI